MNLKYTKIFSLSLIALFYTTSTLPMRLKEYKKNAAYYALQKRREKDFYLPKQQEREIFEFVINFSKTAVATSGPLVTAGTLAVANVLHYIITGKKLTQVVRERTFEYQDRQRERDLKTVRESKAIPDYLSREEFNEISNFPLDHNGNIAYKVIAANNERGYNFEPDYRFAVEEKSITTIWEENKPTGCFNPPEKEPSSTECFPEPEKEPTRTEFFSDEENKKVLAKGCFNDEKISILYNYMRAPWQPTENDRFFPDKKWDGKTRKHPKTGQVGYPDRKGNIWVPTGENPSRAHGKPHWDVIDKDGNCTNVLPGGIVRETGKIFNPYQALPTEVSISLKYIGGNMVVDGVAVAPATKIINEAKDNCNFKNKQPQEKPIDKLAEKLHKDNQEKKQSDKEKEKSVDKKEDPTKKDQEKEKLKEKPVEKEKMTIKKEEENTVRREKPSIKPAHENSTHNTNQNRGAAYQQALHYNPNGNYQSYSTQQPATYNRNTTVRYEYCMKYHSYLNCENIKDE